MNDTYGQGGWIGLLLAIVMLSAIACEEVTEEQKRLLPVPPGATKVVYGKEKYKVIHVSYEITLSYPDLAVLTYYDETLGKQGWRPYSHEKWARDNRGQGWSDYIAHPEGGQGKVHQHIAFWISEDKKRQSILVMRYFSPVKTYSELFTEAPPNNDQLIVFYKVGGHIPPKVADRLIKEPPGVQVE